MTQLNPVLVGRFGPVRVVSVAVLIAVVGAMVPAGHHDHRASAGWLGFMRPAVRSSSPRGRVVHAERPGDRPEPARRDRRHRRRRARRRPVHDRRGGRPAGRRARQRHRGADGGDHRRHHRAGDHPVLVRPTAHAPHRGGELRLDDAEPRQLRADWSAPGPRWGRGRGPPRTRCRRVGAAPAAGRRPPVPLGSPAASAVFRAPSATNRAG